MTMLTIDQPPYEFVAYPNPPLPLHGGLLVIGLVGLTSLLFGLGFLLAGAWPVTPFLGLDVVALAFAFHWIRRRATTSETISVDHETTAVRRRDAAGRMAVWTANSSWTQVRLQQRNGSTSGCLVLAAQGRSLEIGRFLTLDEKRGLAAAIEQALQRAREVIGP